MFIVVAVQSLPPKPQTLKYDNVYQSDASFAWLAWVSQLFFRGQGSDLMYLYDLGFRVFKVSRFRGLGSKSIGCFRVSLHG